MVVVDDIIVSWRHAAYCVETHSILLIVNTQLNVKLVLTF